MNEQHVYSTVADAISAEMEAHAYCESIIPVNYDSVKGMRRALLEGFSRVIPEDHQITALESCYIKEILGLPAGTTEAEIEELINRMRKSDRHPVLNLMSHLADADLLISTAENIFLASGKTIDRTRRDCTLSYTALRAIEEALNIFCACYLSSGETTKNLYQRLAFAKQAAGILETKNVLIGKEAEEHYEPAIPKTLLNEMELDIRFNLYAVITEDNPYNTEYERTEALRNLKKPDDEASMQDFIRTAKAVARKGTECNPQDRMRFVQCLRAGVDIPVAEMNAVLDEPKEVKSETPEEMIERFLADEGAERIYNAVFTPLYQTYRKYFKEKGLK